MNLPTPSIPIAQQITRAVDSKMVIDGTASLQPAIDGIKDGQAQLLIGLNSIPGLDLRFEILVYRDNHDDLHTKWETCPFSADINVGIDFLKNIRARGGGPNNIESTLDAIYLATHASFRENAKKFIMVVTDTRTHPTLKFNSQGPSGDMKRVIRSFEKLKDVFFLLVAPYDQTYSTLCKSLDRLGIQNIYHVLGMNGQDPYFELCHLPWNSFMKRVGLIVSSSIADFGEELDEIKL